MMSKMCRSALLALAALPAATSIQVAKIEPSTAFPTFAPIGTFPPVGTFPPLSTLAPLAMHQGEPEFPTFAPIGTFPPVGTFPPLSTLAPLAMLQGEPEFPTFAPIGTFPPVGTFPPLSMLAPLAMLQGEPEFPTLAPLGTLPPLGTFPPTSTLAPFELPKARVVKSFLQYQREPEFPTLAPLGTLPPLGTFPPTSTLAPFELPKAQASSKLEALAPVLEKLRGLDPKTFGMLSNMLSQAGTKEGLSLLQVVSGGDPTAAPDAASKLEALQPVLEKLRSLDPKTFGMLSGMLSHAGDHSFLQIQEPDADAKLEALQPILEKLRGLDPKTFGMLSGMLSQAQTSQGRSFLQVVQGDTPDAEAKLEALQPVLEKLKGLDPKTFSMLSGMIAQAQSK